MPKGVFPGYSKHPDETSSFIVGCLNDLPNILDFRREYGVDLGAGNLRHSKMLVNKFGFRKVVAIDTDPHISGPVEEAIEVQRKSVTDFRAQPSSLDAAILWNVSYSLSTMQLQEVLRRVRFSLRRHGVFFGNFFSMPEAPQRTRHLLTPFGEEKIRTALEGLELAIQPMEMELLDQLPGAQMLAVLAYKP